MIAPHVNNELDLVIAGDKPLGSVPMGSVTAGIVYANDSFKTFIKETIIYFALTEAPINAYKFLNSSAAAIVVRSEQEHQRLTGRLFGYTEEQIDAFIEANIGCRCRDCEGVNNYAN
jgi:hypothetical protein